MRAATGCELCDAALGSIIVGTRNTPEDAGANEVATTGALAATTTGIGSVGVVYEMIAVGAGIGGTGFGNAVATGSGAGGVANRGAGRALPGSEAACDAPADGATTDGAATDDADDTTDDAATEDA